MKPSTRSRTTTIVVLLTLGLAASGCGGPDTGGEQRDSSDPTPAADLPTEPPTTAAPVPDGTYRAHVTKDALVEAGGYDVSGAGTWTLVLADGTYRLSCSWVDQDGDDCGHTGNPDDVTVEAGQALGDESTLWLDYDRATTMELNDFGEDNPTDDQAPAYRLSWSLDGSDLVLADVWVPGIGAVTDEVNTYTLTPWKKIA